MARAIWDDGVPLGFDGPGKRARPIAYRKKQDRSGNAPTLVLGPPGSSKTVGLVATHLLDEPGKRSFVVFDCKAELAAITANYRRRVCGKDNVKIINPYGLLTGKRPDLKSDQWNPLNALDPGAPGYGDECGALGDAGVKADLNEHQPHFSDCARSAITGGTMFVVKDADDKNMARSLPAVRALFTQAPDALKQSIRQMMKSGDEEAEAGPPAAASGPMRPPVVALFDGLPMALHDRLRDRLEIDDPDDFAAAYGAASEQLHGTAMASLIVHGNLDEVPTPISHRLYVRPVTDSPRGSSGRETRA